MITFQDVAYAALRAVYRVFRPVTLGVKGLVIDSEGKILLVHHSYIPGWHIPGGGVDRGESSFQAMVRELREEVGIECTVGVSELFSFYYNPMNWKNDHVAFFVIRDWERIPNFKGCAEITGAEFYSIDALPEGTTKGTKNRVNELFRGVPKAEKW